MSEEYKSVISSRPAFNRVLSSSMTNLASAPMASGTRLIKVKTEYHTSMGSGALSTMGGSCAQQIRDDREREKRDLRNLNDKLANFIEKVRFLEAQNRIMTTEVDHINNCLSGERSSSTLYETEISGAANVIKETLREKEEAEAELPKLQQQLTEIRNKFEEASKGRTGDREKIDDLLIELSNLEAEIALLKRRIALLEEEVSRMKKENIKIHNNVQSTRSSVDQQALISLQLRNEISSLIEEIEFVKKSQEQELKDLLALASRDTTGENREYFKNEMSNAIRDIREEYESVNASHRQEMESTYQMRIQEFETQTARQNVDHGHHQGEMKKLKTQVSEMRSKLTTLGGRNAQLEKQLEELGFQSEDDQRRYESDLNDKDKEIRREREASEALMIEYQMMMDKQQTLDNELAIYRKMLEGEENSSGLKQLVEQVVRTTAINEVADTETMRVTKGETSSRSSHSKAAKGNVSIKETCPEAHFIILENTHRTKDESIGGWKLKRKIDGKKELVFSFPEDFILAAGSTVTVFARGRGVVNSPESLVFEKKASFGTGANVHTLLFNTEGEERASLIQREVASTIVLDE